MFGNNPKRPMVKSDGNILDVQNIFYTLQGEGPYALHSAIFIRLGGCNLACSFCDTEFESFKKMTIQEIEQSINNEINNSKCNLAVITGGEPFRQNITPLCEMLIKKGLKVQVETNGTLYFNIPDEVEVVCSPKVTNGKYHHIREDLKKHLIAYKFLVSTSLEYYKEIPDWDFDNIAVYVQGIDEIDNTKNKENQKLALKLAMKHGYILSLQTHKILEIE